MFVLLAHRCRGFFVGELDYDDEARAKLVAKKHTPGETAKALESLLEDSLDQLLEWDAAHIEETLRAYCEAASWKASDLFMSVRVAVTGKAATPPLFETMAVLGKEVCRRRLRRAADTLRAVKAPPASGAAEGEGKKP